MVLSGSCHVLSTEWSIQTLDVTTKVLAATVKLHIFSFIFSLSRRHHGQKRISCGIEHLQFEPVGLSEWRRMCFRPNFSKFHRTSSFFSHFEYSCSALQIMSGISKWSAQNLEHGHRGPVRPTCPTQIQLHITVISIKSRARKIRTKHAGMDLVKLELTICYPLWTNIFRCVVKSWKVYWENITRFFLSNIKPLSVYAVSSRHFKRIKCVPMTH